MLSRVIAILRVLLNTNTKIINKISFIIKDLYLPYDKLQHIIMKLILITIIMIAYYTGNTFDIKS